MPTLYDRTWNGTFVATDESPPCPQIRYFNKSEILGDEDCLRLNIYTPSLLLNQTKNITKLPVIVYIHEEFIYSSVSQDFTGPDFLMPHGVILVTINFRLGPLGNYLNGYHLNIVKVILRFYNEFSRFKLIFC